MMDSYSEPLGVVLRGRIWVGEEAEHNYVDVVLRIDEDEEDQPDTLDLRLELGSPGGLILNVPRVDLVRALTLLGHERESAPPDA